MHKSESKNEQAIEIVSLASSQKIDLFLLALNTIGKLQLDQVEALSQYAQSVIRTKSRRFNYGN